MEEWLDRGQMDGWMDRWVTDDAWTDRQMHGWRDELMDDGWMMNRDGWMDDGWIMSRDGWMDGWMMDG